MPSAWPIWQIQPSAKKIEEVMSTLLKDRVPVGFSWETIRGPRGGYKFRRQQYEALTDYMIHIGLVRWLKEETRRDEYPNGSMKEETTIWLALPEK